MNVKDIQEAIAADKILQHELDPHTVVLKEGKVQIPSPTFNALFIAFHALQHYGSGIALHHLCDWAVILKHNGWSILEGINSKRFWEGVMALTCLCNKYLGTSVPVDGGEDIAKGFLHLNIDKFFKYYMEGNPEISAMMSHRFITITYVIVRDMLC